MANLIKYLSTFILQKRILTESGIYTLSLTLFLMPFPRSWSPWVLGATLFLGLLLWLNDYRMLISEFKRLQWLVIPLITYFILHVFYFFLNPEWSNVEDKLMFLLVPVFIFPILISNEFREKSFSILRFYVLGIMVICVFDLGRAFWNSISISEGHIYFNSRIDFSVSALSEDFFSSGSRFRSSQLSFLEHPFYLSLKSIFAIVILAEFRRKLNIGKIACLAAISLLLIFVFFLSSRISFLILVIILIYYFNKFLRRYRLSWLLIPIIPAVFFAAYETAILNPRIHDKTALLIRNYKSESVDMKAIDPRILSWTSAAKIIARHPVFGAGFIARDELASEYERNGYHNEAVLRLNAHNQFLETQMTFGIPGTILLLWMLVNVFKRRKQVLLRDLVIPFLIIIAVSMIFESILVRQWGIMFFVLFYCILTIPSTSGRSPEAFSGYAKVPDK